MITATTALEDLKQRRKEWAPWLAVVGEVLREVETSEWDAVVPDRLGAEAQAAHPALAAEASAGHPALGAEAHAAHPALGAEAPRAKAAPRQPTVPLLSGAALS